MARRHDSHGGATGGRGGAESDDSSTASSAIYRTPAARVHDVSTAALLSAVVACSARLADSGALSVSLPTSGYAPRSPPAKAAVQPATAWSHDGAPPRGGAAASCGSPDEHSECQAGEDDDACACVLAGCGARDSLLPVTPLPLWHTSAAAARWACSPPSAQRAPARRCLGAALSLGGPSETRLCCAEGGGAGSPPQPACWCAHCSSTGDSTHAHDGARLQAWLSSMELHLQLPSGGSAEGGADARVDDAPARVQRGARKRGASPLMEVHRGGDVPLPAFCILGLLGGRPGGASSRARIQE